MSKRLENLEFLRLLVNKELELANADITFDDIQEDRKRPKEERKLDTWFDDYTLDTIEQYAEWKDFFMRHVKDWYGSGCSRRIAENEFGWVSLCYGLRYNFDYKELFEFEKMDKTRKKTK